MTHTEATLRAALEECLALLEQELPMPKSFEECLLLLQRDPTKPKAYKVDVVIGNAKRALDMPMTPTPVFIASDRYVRGASMVFELPSVRLAERTAENLTALFAAHSIAEGARANEDALSTMPSLVFHASGKVVRGPARPEGSGYKSMVFQLPSELLAERTADNLNALFAQHCSAPRSSVASRQAEGAEPSARSSE